MTIVFISFVVLYILVLFLELFFKPRNLKVKDLKIGKKRFVQLVLHWCAENIHDNNTSFDLKIVYQKPTKIMGRYSYFYKMMVIYIDDSLCLLDLTDTVIHEFTHHLQGAPKKHSNKLQSNYYDDPMEVEARRMAEKFRNQCYDAIISKVV
jgi:hypothetical protein